MLTLYFHQHIIYVNCGLPTYDPLPAHIRPPLSPAYLFRLTRPEYILGPIKFGASFVKASAVREPGELVGENEVVDVVLTTFGELVKEWMSGRGFVEFCEYWMGFAKRVGFFSLS